MDSLFDEDALRLLEFDCVLEDISKKAISRYGRERIKSLRPLVDDTDLLYRRASEFSIILQNEGEPPFSVFHDLSDYINRVKRGFSLGCEELYRSAVTMEIICRLKEFFERVSSEFTAVGEVVAL
ncbi:MAG TPA: endonuclease MutS2, partial [Mesotoga sp.]|nr:endonuclease MutS2 [Mesotoga sp.]